MPNCPSCDDVEMVAANKNETERVCPCCGYREEN